MISVPWDLVSPGIYFRHIYPWFDKDLAFVPFGCRQAEKAPCHFNSSRLEQWEGLMCAQKQITD
jgi:hypothetical protein